MTDEWPAFSEAKFRTDQFIIKITKQIRNAHDNVATTQ